MENYRSSLLYIALFAFVALSMQCGTGSIVTEDEVSSLGSEADSSDSTTPDASSPDDSTLGDSPPDNSTPGDSPPSPGAPTLTSMVGGNNQSATVDTAVAEPLQIRVTDNDLQPVSGVSVTFSVDTGGGRVDGATQLTNANGVAAPDAWILGPTPGLNRLRGAVAGLAPITFEATGLADSRGSFTIYAGDRQNASVGTPVPIAPEVLVLDGEGDPVAGRAVTFVVTGGGGEVQNESATTDGQGRAQVGGWTLGAMAGEQQLTARTANLPDLVFRATAVSGQAPTLSSTLIGDMDGAWDFAFLPDGTLLVTAKNGEIRSFDLSGPTVTDRQILAPPSDLDDRDQSGMLGIAVDPNFASNRRVYVFLSSDRGGDVDNRIRRYTLSANGENLVEDQDILTGISYENGAHSGGRIEFGPDGFLYIGTGDNREATVPQDVNEMGGKILRITTDGAPAPGNIDQGGRREIFFRGVRNVQGLAFRRGDGAPFSCEHGPNENDEVTLLVNGGDGGWNPNNGLGDYNGYTGAVMSPAGARQPAYQTNESMGMCDCTFVYGSQWLAYDGALIVGFLGGRHALVMRPAENGLSVDGTPTRILEDDERLRGMTQGPDGDLYVIAGNEIWRVSPGT